MSDPRTAGRRSRDGAARARGPRSGRGEGVLRGPSDPPSPLEGRPGYRSLVEGLGLWEDPDRALLEVSGRAAARALNGLLSADVEALEPDAATLSFVLTPKGRPIAVPTVIRWEGAFVLDCTRDALTGLLGHFATYLPPRFASVRPLDDAVRVSVLGPLARAAVASLAPVEALRIVPRHPADGAGFDCYARDPEEAEVVRAAVREAGGAPVAPADYDVWRVELGIPVFGREVDRECLPQETGLVPRAVSFDKGCYTGQEVVARIHYRGRVHRHLRGLRPASPDSPPAIAAGSTLRAAGRAVGAVTSSVVSPRFGPIALGYLRREVAPGATVEATSHPGTPLLVSELPFTTT